MLFLLSALALARNGFAYDCSATVNGVYFDYRPLKKSSSYYQGTDINAQNYEFNMCGTVMDGGQCQTLNGAMCQVDNNGDTVVISSSTGQPSPQYSAQDAGNMAQGLQLYFDNEPSQPGKECFPQGLTRKLTVLLTCAEGAPIPSTTLQVTETSTCVYTMELASMYGCEAPSGGWDIPGESSGLSFGSILLIILFPGFFVYLAAGCLYKSKTQGTSGMESCPNIDFWRDLPGLVKEGIAFTMGGCKKGSGSGDSGYDEL